MPGSLRFGRQEPERHPRAPGAGRVPSWADRGEGRKGWSLGVHTGRRPGRGGSPADASRALREHPQPSPPGYGGKPAADRAGGRRGRPHRRGGLCGLEELLPPRSFSGARPAAGAFARRPGRKRRGLHARAAGEEPRA